MPSSRLTTQAPKTHLCLDRIFNPRPHGVLLQVRNVASLPSEPLRGCGFAERGMCHLGVCFSRVQEM